MLLSLLTDGSQDIKGYILSFLLMLPALLIGLCGHECAHGYIAYRCGDPTAKLMGRLTMDPRKHLDPIGSLLLVLVGFGWAKPVPVNPNNFRHFRRDDFFVSIAGITYNLCVFALSMLLMGVMLVSAINAAPVAQNLLFSPEEACFTAMYGGERVLFITVDGAKYYLHFQEAFQSITGMAEYLIRPVFGTFSMYLYEMLIYLAIINLTLATFNLLPVPPLDGYHVLNDLILRKQLFAPEKLARVTSAVLMGLILLGNFSPKLDILGKLLGAVRSFAFDTAGGGLYSLVSAVGLL